MPMVPACVRCLGTHDLEYRDSGVSHIRQLVCRDIRACDARMDRAAARASEQTAGSWKVGK